MTDYDLILLCRKDNQEAQVQLFNRYTNLLRMKYASLNKKTSSILYKDFDDFKSEAFLWFMKAVEYTQPSKITSPEKWKFMTPYIFFINKMVDSLCYDEKPTPDHKKNLFYPDRVLPDSLKSKKLFYKPTLVSLDALLSSTDKKGEELVDTIIYHDEEDPTFDQVVQNMSSETFMKNLSSEEKKIIDSMIRLDAGKVPSYEAIAQRLSLSRAWASSKMRGLKTKYQKFLKNWM